VLDKSQKKSEIKYIKSDYYLTNSKATFIDKTLHSTENQLVDLKEKVNHFTGFYENELCDLEKKLEGLKNVLMDKEN